MGKSRGGAVRRRTAAVMDALEGRTLLSVTFSAGSADFTPQVMASALAYHGAPAVQIFGWFGQPAYQYSEPFTLRQEYDYGGAYAIGESSQSVEFGKESAHARANVSVSGSAAETTPDTPFSVGTYAASDTATTQAFTILLSNPATITISGDFLASKSSIYTGWGASFILFKADDGEQYVNVSAATTPDDPNPPIPDPVAKLTLPAGEYVVVAGVTASAVIQLGGSYTAAASYDVTISVDEDEPDLKIFMGALPKKSAPGKSFNVATTVSNGGGGDAPVSQVGYYLSKDAILDSTDPRIGGRSIPAIKQGEEFGFVGSVTIPPKTVPRNYYIIAKADDGDTIDEGDEGNNAASGSVIVEANCLPWGKTVSREFRDKVKDIASDIGTDPGYLMAAMAFETDKTFDPAKQNPRSKAIGLIQFTEDGIDGLGTSLEELRGMGPLKQLTYVAKYFAKYKGKVATLEDLYMAILLPRAIGKQGDFVLFDKESSSRMVRKRYEQNKKLDSDPQDGKVSKDEAAAKVRGMLKRGSRDDLCSG